MKKLPLLAVLSSIVFASSCANMEMKKIEMSQVDQMTDSILKKQIIPGSLSIHILQDDDYSKVTLIIRNSRLYAKKEEIQSAAVRSGLMLLNVLGKDASI